jgi:hypothetical protein
MKNELLYQEFIKKYPESKRFLDQCVYFEEQYNKHLYNMNLNESIELVKTFPSWKQMKIKLVCKRYCDMVIENCFTDIAINAFDLINLS